jgi:peptidylprolyl isomerase
MFKKFFFIFLVLISLLGIGCQRRDQVEQNMVQNDSLILIYPDPIVDKLIVLESGLKYVDTQIGTGRAAVRGDVIVVNYVGKLSDGTQFDSSYDRETSFEFQLGMGMVIPGWDQGIMNMRAGGKRRLIIPPALAYGEEGVAGRVPANAVLYFEVELVEIK